MLNPLQKLYKRSLIISLHINSQINWATDGQIDFSLSAVNNSKLFISGAETFSPSHPEFSDCKIDFYCIELFSSSLTALSIPNGELLWCQHFSKTEFF
jgi:hypothetical protein